MRDSHEIVVVPLVVKLGAMIGWHNRFVGLSSVRVIVPVKPSIYVTVIVEVSAFPIFWDAGEVADIEKPAVTVNVAVVERTTGPLVPMMFSVKVPITSDVHEIVALPFVVTLSGLMAWQDRFATVLLVSAIVPVKPLR